VTGLLVPFEPRDDGSRDPVDAARFARDIAERVNELVADPARAKRMGEAGRARAIECFAWSAIASETAELYRGLLGAAG
jgi:starch synthase